MFKNNQSLPKLIPSPVSVIASVFTICFCWFITLPKLHGQPSGISDPKFWIPDGPVYAILATNDTVYIGGDFSYIGPRTGPLALFDQASGSFVAAPPRINGTIKAAIPDGAGGWFIGGTFNRIGTVAATNVARLKSDLTHDIGWNARVVGTTVNALALDNGRLYVGGQFTRIGGQTISGLAGVSAANATLNWNPVLSGTVNAICVTNGLAYVGGSFFSVGASNVQNLAAISTTTALATGWNPSPDSTVFALFVTATNVYVGGQFATIGTKSRNRLAALDLEGGVANNWNPNPNGIVRALYVTPTNAYVGGDFTTISVASRRGFASIGLPGTGTAQALNLQLQSVGTVNLVRSITLNGSSLYVGGQFTNALGNLHFMVVGVDILSNAELPTPLGTDFNGPPGTVFGANALASANGQVLVGGDFQSIGGVTRRRAAALSLTTGAALPWAPSFDASVLCFAYGTNRLYVGGSFTSYNSTNAIPKVGLGLGAVDPVNGNPVTFSFLGTNLSGFVSIRSLVTTSNALYVGGDFTIVADQARRFVAAIDPATGTPISAFNARLGGGFSGINSLALVGTNLYLAGDFTTVNTLAIPRLAAVSSSTGTNRSWIPSPNQPPAQIVATPSVLYVGGPFTLISGVTLNHVAVFDLADNSLIPIDASLANFDSVNTLAATPTVVYVAGAFAAIGGDFRLNLASLSPADATPFAWNPSPEVGPTTIALTDNYAFFGGTFRSMGQSPTNQINPFFVAFSRVPQIVISKSPPSSVQISLSTGDRTDAVLQGNTNLMNLDGWTDINIYAPGFPQTVVLPATLPHQLFRVIAR